MVSIDRVYQTVLSIVNREGFSYINPQEFSLLANQAQIEIFEEYFGDKSRAMLQPNMDDDYADKVRNLEEKISMFEVTAENVMENMSTDIFEYPSDLYRLGRVFVNDVVADEVSRKDAAYVNLSPLTAPTKKQPIYVRRSSGIKLYPSELMDTDSVDLVYIKKPSDVRWDGTSSINFELHPSEFPELVVKILGYVGIILQRQDISQFAQIQEGEITQNEQ